MYDSQPIRADLGRSSVPHTTTLLKFRRLLEAKRLTRQIFDAIDGYLAKKDLMMHEGTIIDAALLSVPQSNRFTLCLN